MTQAEVIAFVEALENIQREENFGYIFFFVGDDHRLSFVTIADSDNDYDDVSHLDREGVFRINIGVSRKTFESLFGDSDLENVDYSVLNEFLPHPHYAKQNFICILNPSGDNADQTKQYIVEAHDIAASRLQRRTSKVDAS